MRLTLVGLLAAVSCASAPDPAPKDWSGAYPPLLEKLPANDAVAAVGDLGHLIERLDALRRLALTGPATRLKLEPLLAEVRKKVGWDPFSPEAWQAQGLAPASPAALVLDVSHPALWLRARDATKLTAALAKLELRCAPSDGWLACSSDDGSSVLDGKANGVATAADAKSSVWARIVETVPADARKMDLLLFAPVAEAAERSQLSFLKGSQAAWGALRADEREVRLRGGYLNPELRDLEKYLRLPPKSPTVLGAGRGSDAVARMSFSPPALWALAQKQLPPRQLDQMTGAFAMMTGLDLAEDVVQNLTGEIAAAMTKSGVTVTYLGARDDAKTARLVEKLYDLTAGWETAMQQPLGMKLERGSEQVHGFTLYHCKITIPAAQLNLPQPLDYELSFAAGRGAIVFGFDRSSVAAGIAALGQPVSRFLAELPPGDRARFASDAAIVGFFRSIDSSRWMSNPFMSMAKVAYAEISPAAWPILVEMMQVWELIWDGNVMLDVRGDKAELDYQLRLL